MMKYPEICAVICSYQMAPEQICLRLRDFGQRIGVKITGVVVCNGPHPLPANTAEWTFLKGTNEDLDFSAYMEGAEYLIEQGQVPECALVLNDTLFTSHNGFRVLRDILKYREPVRLSPLPAIAGKTDPYDNACYSNPWSGLGLYVSTFCFLINRGGIQLLLTLRQKADLDLGASKTVLTDPGWGAGLAPAFKEYLKAHLVYRDTSVSWYRLRKYENNNQLIGKKARGVYFEHRLSGDIGASGVIFSVYPRPLMKARFFVFEQIAKVFRKLRWPKPRA
ncbi:hypothetical protein PAP18089_00074 [Pandoraea apista]|nr:hypothetical protein [Pandoraea apista]RSD15569.1 hypothetical protein EIZ52_16335 [Pandoraea apista]VVG69123.1 hypothetical protein PAP18089_00074 [Pandoraea apista]